jgi:hypothetical protein
MLLVLVLLLVLLRLSWRQLGCQVLKGWSWSTRTTTRIRRRSGHRLVLRTLKHAVNIKLSKHVVPSVVTINIVQEGTTGTRRFYCATLYTVRGLDFRYHCPRDGGTNGPTREGEAPTLNSPRLFCRCAGGRHATAAEGSAVYRWWRACCRKNIQKPREIATTR